MSKQNSLANITIIAIMVVLAGAAGYFALVKQPEEVSAPKNDKQRRISPQTQQNNAPSNNYNFQSQYDSQTQAQTKPGWRTFSNKEYGFSISFPNEFVAEDGSEDFQWLCSGCGSPLKNAEYFYFCDGTYMPPTGEVCSGSFSYFGVQLHDYVVNQALIDSWGGEVVYSQQTTINGKPAWVVKMCTATGCSVSIKFNHDKGTLNVSFYNDLYIDTAGPLFISDLAKEILDTLQF
jgi:hypothetical protein